MVLDGMGNLKTSVTGLYLIPIAARLVLLDEPTSQLLNFRHNAIYNLAFDVCLCRRIGIQCLLLL